MKRLLATGCSSTAGLDFPDEYDQQNSTWPMFVGRELNLNTTNIAIGGSSNEHIFQQIVSNSINYDYVLISWSEMDRITRTESSTWLPIHFRKNLRSEYEKKDFYSTYGKYHFLYWSSLVGNFIKWLSQIVYSQAYLKSINKPYYMICTARNHYDKLTVKREYFIKNLSELINISNFDDEMILQKYDEIQLLLNQIDFNHFLSPNDFVIVRDIIKSNKYKVSNTGHALVDGHKAIADIVLSKINFN